MDDTRRTMKNYTFSKALDKLYRMEQLAQTEVSMFGSALKFSGTSLLVSNITQRRLKISDYFLTTRNDHISSLALQ